MGSWSDTRITWSAVRKYVAHGRAVQQLAEKCGWYPAARYTNLRDVRRVAFTKVGFLDIHWKRYSFARHLESVRAVSPLMTVARDIESIWETDAVLREAEALARHASFVVIVPKDRRLARKLDSVVPREYLLGYSVPTRYGGTSIRPEFFTRPVHLLGGRPDIQRQLGNLMPVVSFDCNRFTLDARFGDFFDGRRFRPHPRGGYERCLQDSLRNINLLWNDYRQPALFSRAG